MKISELPQASSVGANDMVPIVQAGVTKKARRSLLTAIQPFALAFADENGALTGDADKLSLADGELVVGSAVNYGDTQAMGYLADWTLRYRTNLMQTYTTPITSADYFAQSHQYVLLDFSVDNDAYYAVSNLDMEVSDAKNHSSSMDVLALDFALTGSGTLAQAQGLSCFVQNRQGGTMTLAGAVSAYVQNEAAGEIGSASGVNATVFNQGLGHIGTATGLFASVENTGGGVVDLAHGLLIGTISATQAWAIYSNSPAKSFFAGDVIQHPSASVTPANNGDLTIEATNDTHLTFKYKGSDGQVRSAAVTLS